MLAGISPCLVAGAPATRSDSGVSVVSGHNYKLEMVLNFTSQSYQGFYTDITASGTRTSLGTQTFYTDATHPTVDPTLLNSQGGIGLASRLGGGNRTVIFDDIQMGGTAPSPEPSTLVLLGTGIVGLLAYAWRKRR